MEARIASEALFLNRAAEQLCRLFRFDGASTDWIEVLTPAEWAAMAENAVYFGFAPLCYIRLRELGKLEALPPQISRNLKNDYLVASGLAALRLQDLKSVVQKLDQLEIPVIFLKGVYLAEEVYPDRAMRLMSDVDLMIPRDRLGQAAEAVAPLGYLSSRDYWVEFETTVSHQIPTLIKPRHAPIEFHWTLLTPRLPYKVDLPGLWERAIPFKAGEISGWALSPADLILHLTIHAATQHKLTSGLRFIYDIAIALDHFRDAINWAQLEERTRGWHAMAPVYLALRLSQAIFGSGAPDDFMSAIRPAEFDQTWLDTARDLLFLNQDEHPPFSRNMASMLAAQSLGEKIRLILKRVFLPPEAMAENYPVLPNSPRVLLYYPRHLKILVSKHIRSLIGLTKQDAPLLNSAQLAHILQEREDYLNDILTR